MGRPIDTFDKIAIAQIIFYIPTLIAALFLCRKHGFTKAAGWGALLILGLAQTIGASLRLATLADPDNKNLYIGWMTTQSIDLCPLILLVSSQVVRVFDSIRCAMSSNSTGSALAVPKKLRLLELLPGVAIILLIVGGTKSEFVVISPNDIKADYSTVSQAAVGLLIAVTALLTGLVLFALRHQGYIAQGEHRVLLAVVICMPFLIVRLVYSCMVILGGIHSSAWLSLGLCILMDMFIVLICLVMGFSVSTATPQSSHRRSNNSHDEETPVVERK